MSLQPVFILSMIALTLGICGPLNPAPNGQASGNQSLNQSSSNQQPAIPPQPGPPLPNVTQADLQTWSDINETSVGQACLISAKGYAGKYAWAVKSCSCKETKGEYTKDYDCSVSTLQGAVPARVSCVLADTTCNVTSSYGNSSMTFEQIRQFQPQR
jgi:hypothetical protein